ncbi:FAD-binding dehydrogenase, partial [Streptococcus anginosus]|nr:FAD-binding dehydrogenase [Streptococcus anginosus]
LYTQNEVYSILDTGVIEKMAKDGNYMCLGVYVERGDKMDKLAAEIDQAVADKKPFIFKADTIEELAEKTGLPKDQLTATIARYNGFAAKGEDEDFGKDADYLVAV